MSKDSKIALALLAVAGISIANMKRIRKNKHRQEARAAVREYILNIQAITRARDTLEKRAQTGEFDDIPTDQFKKIWDETVEFEQIAVRNR